MRLVYKATQQPVTVGDIVILDGRRYAVEYCPRPHKPDSSGKVTLKREGTIGHGGFEVYVSGIGAEWIEREDHANLPPVRIVRRNADGSSLGVDDGERATLPGYGC